MRLKLKAQQNKEEGKDGEYQKESNTVYVGGFDRHLAFEDLENFL